ncbi:NAD(P)-dependent oxidoreductase [Lysinibacillus sp. LZ02]|uniref:NAD(P)-dependent oxidoreductase n=1 Tax=Lysinibacillus sp. LZ02 TaxID=3420668 RepID=UPI003D360C35
MKLIVFGATGGVGQEFVKMAIKQGHKVTAFVRTPDKLHTKVDVNIIQGDAFDASAVAQAINGHDAVVSCIGSTAGPEKHTSIQKMGRNIADGMEAAGIKRIVYCASAGINGEIPGISGKMVMKMLEKPLKDHRAALDYILAKDVIYTIARPMGLKNTPLELDYVESFDSVPHTSRSIPRASVAHFMLKALTDEKYDNQSVGLASAK